jgi:serine/threonine-protein kinase HipA
MDRELLVYIDLDKKPLLVGRLWTRLRKDKESATFEYDKQWLNNPIAFSLEPALTLGPGPFHTHAGKALFGALGDSAPDRWGRVLMRRAERRRAEQEKSAPQTLSEIDFLLMVDDEARQGALRFTENAGGPFLRHSAEMRIPPLIELPRLLKASERFEDERDTAEDIRLLLAPGSSLGGARPKASVRERNGTLAIAKFPHKTDQMQTVLWEAVALKLATSAGLTVPAWRIHSVAKRSVLISRRFDRDGVTRIPFLSAMSMLGASDNETHSYLEIADAIRQYGAAPVEDLKQLWRRIVFNVLISNTDDHLRNHAFLYTGTEGWRLSPAYDLNPTPVDLKPRILSTLIDTDDGTASLDLALSVAGYFNLSLEHGRRIAGEVGAAVSRWRRVATQVGLRKSELDEMSSAFDHVDLKSAVKCAVLQNT